MVMIPLDHSSRAVSLAALHNVTSVIEDFKGPLFALLVLQGSDWHILKWNDTLWCSLCCVLEIVKTTIIQDKPTSLPAFPTSALKMKVIINHGHYPKHL